MVFLGQHDLDFAHVVENQYEKVHLSLEFLKFVANLGISKVGVLGVWVLQWVKHVINQFIFLPNLFMENVVLGVHFI